MMSATETLDLELDERSARVSVGPVTLVALLLAAGAIALAVVAAAERASAGWWVGAAVVSTWAVCAAVVARRVPLLGLDLSLVAIVMAAALAAGAAYQSSPGAGGARLRSVAFALMPGVAVLLALSLPDGRLATRGRVLVAVASIAASVAFGVAVGDAKHLPVGTYVLVGCLAAVISVIAFVQRCRGAGALDRARLQWMGWGVVVAATAAAVIVLLHWLVDLPHSPGVVALGFTVVVPLAFVASTIPALLRVIDRVLVQTTIIVGVVALVGAIYLLVVVGLGRVPEHGERTILVLSMIAAALAAVLAFPARRRLEEVANQRVYGERTAPDEALKTFAGRMSRAVPMDELLLQLVETLRKTMHLRSASIWTGSGGVVERAVSVPDQPATRVTLSAEELAVVARAKVQGNAWLQVWIPKLLEGSTGSQLRVASVAHLGELLGLIVAERPSDEAPFSEEEDEVLIELARQVGLALHNVRLDSALQASLEELQVRNEELQASRLRIVTASDESRRSIERNLHDGAQQHLVAMAVKLGLARQLVEADPATASTLMEELRSDVQDTLGALRELAHGIYPPLLRDRGLGEALVAAANRSALPAEVATDGIGRYPTETEAAVYFCCLEAMQNAGKHAGEGSRLTITVSEDSDADRLRFAVADDGAGFDPAVVIGGHGFENMRDRLGAIGGELQVTSSPGEGASVGGSIPLDHVPTEESD
jgi:signal transduction histidine kinase